MEIVSLDLPTIRLFGECRLKTDYVFVRLISDLFLALPLLQNAHYLPNLWEIFISRNVLNLVTPLTQPSYFEIPYFTPKSHLQADIELDPARQS